MHFSRPVLILSGFIALSLAGCASNSSYWLKPGATATQFQQIKTACLMEGAKQVPVALANEMNPGTSTVTRQCNRDGQNCVVTREDMPPTVTQYDANTGLRREVVRSCLARNGWTLSTADAGGFEGP